MKKEQVQEKILHPANGYLMLLLGILLLTAGIGAGVAGSVIGGMEENGALIGISITVCVILVILGVILLCGLKVLNPNEAYVLTLFGNYYGTIKKEGFFWVNPFCSAINPTVKAVPVATGSVEGRITTAGVSAGGKKVSLRMMTLDNKKQKVNDLLGNPVEIGAVVIWRVVDPTKAVINVENYKNYLSIQCDAIIRNTARQYPYDTNEGGDEKSHEPGAAEEDRRRRHPDRGSADHPPCVRTGDRICHAAAAAGGRHHRRPAEDRGRRRGHGGNALHKLNENDIVDLDEERKAAMVSNLLVVLCGNKEAQPIVNSGSLY